MVKTNTSLTAEPRTKQSAQPEVMRILAVDDEPDILEIYQSILAGSSEGPDAGPRMIGAPRPARREADPCLRQVELTVCTQGADALKAAEKALEEKKPYFLVFLDMHMPPGLDGGATAQRMRALDPNIDIVMVTGSSGGLASREISARIPPPEKLLYLQKPFFPDQIRHIAAALFAKSLAERQLRSIRKEMEDIAGQQLQSIAVLSQALKDQLGQGAEQDAQAVARAAEEITRRINQAISETQKLLG